MSNSPALNNGSYTVLFLWGALGISIFIVAVLLVYTSLGHPLNRRLLSPSPPNDSESDKSGQFNTSELEAHTFDICAPHPPGTPAPPYEWVLRITPPPQPTAHFRDSVAHIAPTLTHRFSDIPRVPSEQGLGIQVEEAHVGEKHIIKTSDNLKPTNLHPRNPLDSHTEAKQAVPMSGPGQNLPLLHLSVAERGTVPKAMEEVERRARQDRYRALLLQSNEQTRQEILKNMPEEDRVIALAL